ncbi:hypothetical protein NQ314_002589 [Rhamnusium bicolor]|uniref:HAT C-terminal dimerisation domain-containing protein n=1 Tax=Rhamnusium bicolor TaxID=1586634 RepID=A0AAV8ZR95_9CUCU|nr:hypothetical protein NQ314_002589 [Rhamnusium bicolor]
MLDEESDRKTIQLSKGFLNEMNNFEFTLLAVVFNDIFCLTGDLFGILQKKSLDINYCLLKIKSTREIINSKRNEDDFMQIFEKTNKMTPTTRKRTERTLTDDEIYQNYRVLFYEILDNISMEMDVRFKDCEKLQFLSLVDTTKFEKFTTDFPATAVQNLQQCYPQLFNKTQRLKNELCLLYADEMYRNITIEKALQLLQENKDVFQEVYKLFSLVLTIPSTSVSVERCFSCLKRIKTYTINNIPQDRFSLENISINSIQLDLLQDLMKKQPFYEDITDRFAALKDRKIDLTYKK